MAQHIRRIKCYSVCDHKHVPMIEHSKYKKYKFRNANGKADSFFSDSTYKLPKKSHFTLDSKELDFSVRHSMVLRIP